MTQTDVTIDSSLIATPNDVPVVQGNTFTITADETDATLFFSRDCQSLLSPAPAASVALAEGDTLTFTFTTSRSANYMIVVAGDPNAHVHFLPIKSTTLTITTFIHSTRGSAGPSNQLQGQ